MTHTSSKAPVAYLTGEYPALSHTFILREIAALRDLGVEVLPCAIRRTQGAHIAGEAEAAEVQRTYYVIAAAKRPATLFAAVLWSFARPSALGHAIGLAWRTRSAGAKATLWQVFYLIEAMVLAHHLAQKNVRHLHNHFANSSCTVAMLASVLAGIPFSFTLHGPAIFFEPRRWHIGEKIARARFVACISHYCRSQGMIFANPAHWSRMHIVHCGIDPSRYRRGTHTPEKKLIFVGRLAAVKGVAVLLEAVAVLAEEHPDLHLTLIGDGSERSALEDRAGRLGIADRVTFAGPKTQDEVAQALSTSDLFVLPSFAEGVPVVLMEAMASQLPVIATRIAGISELVEDGTSGLLVPPGDVKALQAAISQMLSHDDMRSTMGEAGRAQVVEHFDATREASRLADLINTP